MYKLHCNNDTFAQFSQSSFSFFANGGITDYVVKSINMSSSFISEN